VSKNGVLRRILKVSENRVLIRRLRVSEKWVLRRILGSKGQEVTVGYKKLRSNILDNF
jgi:hypothetical protein